jgi:hypothetical protein
MGKWPISDEERRRRDAERIHELQFRPISPPSAAMQAFFEQMEKALSAGYDLAAPSSSTKLAEGAPLVIEDLAPVMRVVTFNDEHLRHRKPQSS